MPRLLDGNSLTNTTFIEEWTRLSGVSSLLACAERTGVRIGVWGGCVRNFILDDRPLSTDGRSLHFVDFIDPYSDIDCVLDRADDWPLIAQSISSSVAFAGYHRWEVQTLEQVISSANHYARIAAESLIVWHEGFDKDRKPKIQLQPLEGNANELLIVPALQIGRLYQQEKATLWDPWQEVFDSLRLSRYFLQYGGQSYLESHPVFPDRFRIRNILESPDVQRERRSHNWLRFDLALLDILMTAAALPDAMEYLRKLAEILPPSFIERSYIFTKALPKYSPKLAFMGGLVYRQRNGDGIRVRLLTHHEENLSLGGITSVVPWTLIWSLGSHEDECCRHEDFKNGIAVVSWRPVIGNITFSQKQAFELAPVAQIARETPYAEPQQMYEKPEKKQPASSSNFVSIPGIVRVGTSLTLRFDHAYMAHFFGRNVQASIGVLDPETIE